MSYRLTPSDDDAPRRTSVARRGVAVLPTLFTLGNLVCGFAAIFVASRTDPKLGADLPWDWTPLFLAACLIFLGMAFDGIDGRVARLTRSTSELGEQLDSMADMVTFGVAPAFLACQLAGVAAPFVSNMDTLFDRFALVVAGIYVVCAALRLARFNIETADDEDHDHLAFKGLPSPGAAGTVASLVLLHQYFLARHPADHITVQVAAVVMVVVTLLAAIGMVSRFRYVHVMNRYVRGRAPFGTIAKVVIAVALLLVWPQFSLAVGFVAYALSAPAGWTYRLLRHRSVHRKAA